MSKENGEFLREVADEIAAQKYREIWQKYGRMIVSGVAVAFVAFVVFITVRGYGIKSGKKYSARLYDAAFLIDKGRIDEAEEGLRDMIEGGSAPEGIESLAALRLGGVLIAKGEAQKALEVYLKVFNNADYDVFVRELSGLLALSVMVDLDEGDGKRGLDIETLVSDLVREDGYFSGFALEQKAMFEWKRGNFDIAKEIFVKVANDATSPYGLRKRAMEMIEIYDSEHDL